MVAAQRTRPCTRLDQPGGCSATTVGVTLAQDQDFELLWRKPFLDRELKLQPRNSQHVIFYLL